MDIVREEYGPISTPLARLDLDNKVRVLDYAGLYACSKDVDLAKSTIEKHHIEIFSADNKVRVAIVPTRFANLFKVANRRTPFSEYLIDSTDESSVSFMGIITSKSEAKGPEKSLTVLVRPNTMAYSSEEVVAYNKLIERIDSTKQLS